MEKHSSTFRKLRLSGEMGEKRGSPASRHVALALEQATYLLQKHKNKNYSIDTHDRSPLKRSESIDKRQDNFIVL